MSLVSELKRRNVFRVAAAYLVVGWLLTEVLTTILPTLGAPDWAVTAVILIFVFGFIPTVILSWVYELTPEGIKKEEDVDRESAIGRGSIRKLDYITISAVGLAIIFVAFFSARELQDGTTSDETVVSNESIAVLPFVNISKDEDNEYFSDGLTESLLHMLAQIPGLKVAARTSSFAFKGKNINIREIAKALQVAQVLEGSVQQVGNRVAFRRQGWQQSRWRAYGKHGCLRFVFASAQGGHNLFIWRSAGGRAAVKGRIDNRSELSGCENRACQQLFTSEGNRPDGSG